MPAQILEGKKVAEAIYNKILLDLSLLPSIPKLSVILVGNDPASETYVKSKTKKCRDLGYRGESILLPDTISEADLVQKIHDLNRDKEVSGILLQLPVPKHINRARVLKEIDPLKDVDGLHIENAGRLFAGEPRFVPCTPNGVIEMLKFYNIPMEGKNAVVVGRSEIVGKPMAQLLLMQNATVTICHSKTEDLKAVTSGADILVAAMGRPRFITAEYVKKGATVIDVGIHRIDGKIAGDVESVSVMEKAGYLSPVPGGVGPMTIAMLMKNVLLAAQLQSAKQR